MAKLTREEHAKQAAADYWRDTDAGNHYPHAFISLRSWCDFAGVEYDPVTGPADYPPRPTD